MSADDISVGAFLLAAAPQPEPATPALPPMLLKRIQIQRTDYYSSDPMPGAKLQGKVELAGVLGTVEINLNDEMSRRVIGVIAGCIGDIGSASIQTMIADILRTNAEGGAA